MDQALNESTIPCHHWLTSNLAAPLPDAESLPFYPLVLKLVVCAAPLPLINKQSEEKPNCVLLLTVRFSIGA